MAHSDEKDRINSIREELLSLAEPKLAAFSAGLLRKPGEETLSGTAAHVMGVRLPALRKIAKRLSREDWKGYSEALSAYILKADEKGLTVTLEEVMLWGFLIGNARLESNAGKAPEDSPAAQSRSAKTPKRPAGRSKQEEIPLAEQFGLIGRYVSCIDNWSLCDSFCAGLKFAREYPAETWDFIQPFLRSEKEYEIRFGVVMILNYFITEAYIARLFPVFDAIKHDGYYVKMAVAWAVSMCYVKFPEETQGYLENNSLDDFTFNKALQKIVESRSVTEEVRRRMRQMKRQPARTA